MYWFLLKSILSSVLGSQFYKWYAQTKMVKYFQNRINQFMEYVSQKYDIEIAKKQSKFEQDYPKVMERINKLEKNSHPCKEFHEFEVYPELMSRLEEIERRLKIKKK